MRDSQPNNNNKRGDITRLALIEAGLELFGEYGFKATSTRMVATQSGTNISAIPYYFGSKEGLYLAVVEHILERVGSYIGPEYMAIQKELKAGKLDRTKSRALIQRIVKSIARMFVDSDEPKSWALIIMREQVKPTDAFDIFYNGMMKNMHGMLSTLIAAYVGIDPKSAEAKIRAHTIIGQSLIFLSSRETLLRQLGTKKLSIKHVDLIHKVLLAQVEACLELPPIGE